MNKLLAYLWQSYMTVGLHTVHVSVPSLHTESSDPLIKVLFFVFEKFPIGLKQNF